MNNLLLLTPLLAALWWASSPAAAQSAHRRHLDKLIISENGFAQQGTDLSTRQAFLNALDTGSVLFSGNQPVNGYGLWQGRPESREGLLSWFPAVAAVSAAGDLGFTSGPATYRQKRGDAVPVHFGYYFSIWRRDPEGRFKLLLDGGTSRPKPEGEDLMGEKQLLDGAPLADWPAGKTTGTAASLLAAEKRLNQLAAAEPVQAYRRYLAPDAWLLREGRPVGKTKPGAQELISAAGVQSYGFTSKGSGVARSNDFAYTYGLVLATYLEADGSRKERPGFYLRAWQYGGTDWQLVGEMVGHQ